MKISIGILTNLFSIPPGILLVQIFRRSTRKRNVVKNDAKQKVPFNLNNSRMTYGTKQRKTFKLPWWCKIIAYIVSLVTMALCITLIIFKGIYNSIFDLNDKNLMVK